MDASLKKKTPETIWFFVAVFSLLATILIHGYLTYRHMQVTLGDATSASICNMNETYNCDAVAASRFSAFLGIPLALWGTVTNLILLVFLFFYKWTWREGDHFIGRIALQLSGFVLLMSLIMGAISLTQLSVYCPFCIATYFLSILTFIAIYQTVAGPLSGHIVSDLKALFGEKRSTLGILIAIPALTWMLNGMLHSQYQRDPAKLEQMVNYNMTLWKSAQSFDFSHLTGLQMGVEKDAAKLTIHEFADFRCGHCRAAAPRLHAFVKGHNDTRLVFLSYPLDGSCNPNIKTSSGLSCYLAKAVFCANEKGNGWKAHDYIFERQHEFGSLPQVEKAVKDLAEAMQLPWTEFEACINSESVDQEIRRQASAGGDAGVNGTPAIFVNGKRLMGGQDLNLLKAVYSEMN